MNLFLVIGTTRVKNALCKEKKIKQKETLRQKLIEEAANKFCLASMFFPSLKAFMSEVLINFILL